MFYQVVCCLFVLPAKVMTAFIKKSPRIAPHSHKGHLTLTIVSSSSWNIGELLQHKSKVAVLKEHGMVWEHFIF